MLLCCAACGWRPSAPDGAADVLIPDGVIGTAELTSASEDNTVSGTVVVTAGAGGFDVALEDFHSDVPGGVQLFFSNWSETTTRLADMHSFSFGNPLRASPILAKRVLM
ncbi:MAG: hypothetical protein H7288_00390 [Kineosporiaceae bacterium]|nr:hypothetical protein [Aeromicrobium sp.]